VSRFGTLARDVVNQGRLNGYPAKDSQEFRRTNAQLTFFGFS
jgi:hypothetical protein